MNIHELYQDVIDESGRVKLCGRGACIRLIKAMEERFPHVNFGDEHGYINVPTMVEYYEKYKGDF